MALTSITNETSFGQVACFGNPPPVSKRLSSNIIAAPCGYHYRHRVTVVSSLIMQSIRVEVRADVQCLTLPIRSTPTLTRLRSQPGTPAAEPKKTGCAEE